MSRCARTTCIAFVAIATGGVALATASSGARAQDSTRDASLSEIAVLEPRPLAKAILELESRLGVVITFEDPEYEFDGDIEDVTWAQRPSARSHRLLVPRTKAFHFSYEERRTSRPEQLIPAMIQKYQDDGNTDAYRVVRDGQRFHVVPIRSADSSGIPIGRGSRLEARVSVVERSRTVYELLKAVLDQVSVEIQRPVGLGLAPMSMVTATRVSHGAQNERARDVIVRALGATGAKLSWQLFCGPGQPRLCMFNVHVVSSGTARP